MRPRIALIFPDSAPLPVPIIIEVGVARPIAHVQAKIRSATVFRSEKVWAGAGQSRSQTTNVTAATLITAGTNTALIRSARRWMGPFPHFALIRAGLMLYPPNLYVKLTLPVEASCGDRYAYDSDHSVRSACTHIWLRRAGSQIMDRPGELVPTGTPHMGIGVSTGRRICVRVHSHADGSM